MCSINQCVRMDVKTYHLGDTVGPQALATLRSIDIISLRELHRSYLLGRLRYGVDDTQNAAGHRNLTFRLFAERYTDSVAYPIGKQRAYAYSRLHSAILSISGFRNAEMKGEVHVLGIHGCNQPAHSLHHHRDIRGFDGYDHVAEIMLETNAQKFHGALHHSCRSVAVTAHDAVREGTMVDPDTQCGVMLPAYIEQRQKPILYL